MQASREYSPKQRMMLLAVAAVFFLFLFPALLVTLGRLLDRWLGWPSIQYASLKIILGLLLAFGGWALGLWSNYVQFTLGRGTPVPLMATQTLIVEPPYTYCRNPMALGAIVMYFGVAVLFGSLGAVVLVLPGAVALLSYIKLFEEKEMELRFGQAYLEYKQRTAFLIPRWLRKRESSRR